MHTYTYHYYPDTELLKKYVVPAHIKIIQSKQRFFHFMIGAISITVTVYRSEKTPNPDQSEMTSSNYILTSNTI